MGKTIAIFVEGDNDYDFFDKLIKPKFEIKGFKVEIIPYQEEGKKFVNTYIDFVITNNQNYETYIFTRDLDKVSNNSELSYQIKQKKIKLIDIYSSVSKHNIFIIIKTIEGWYLAGLLKSRAENLGLNLEFYDKLNPNTISKTKFLAFARRSGYETKKLLYLDILDAYDLPIARSRNESFNYFNVKYCPD